MMVFYFVQLLLIRSISQITPKFRILYEIFALAVKLT